MVDLHCHIIPNIDDGARDINISLAMINEAKKHGFTGAFATSHFIEGELENNFEIMNKEVEKLKSELANQKISFDIYLGNEIYVSNNTAELIKNKKVCTLNNSKYILIEFPLYEKMLNTKEIIFQLLSEGYVPIIAHPERYMWVQNNPNDLIDLINMGALIQVNAGSIIDVYGIKPRKTVKILLKNNMVHFIGTDSHSVNRVYAKMDEAIKKLEKFIGHDKLYILKDKNPKKVVSDETIDIEEPIKYKRRLWF